LADKIWRCIAAEVRTYFRNQFVVNRSPLARQAAGGSGSATENSGYAGRHLPAASQHEAT